jgi:hypothetical protein
MALELSPIKADFGNVGGLGMLLGSASAMSTKAEEDKQFYDRMLELSQSGDIAGQGGLLATRGAQTQNPQLLLQGTELLAQAQKQKSLVQIDSLMDVLADPTKSAQERAAASTKAETIAFSPAVGMTPQSFNSLVNGANSQRESTLNSQARSLVSMDRANAVVQYKSMYGEQEAWRVNNALRSATETEQAIQQQDLNAFIRSERPNIVSLDTRIAQFNQAPVTEWNMSELNSLVNQRMQVEQAIADKGGNVDPSKYVGLAERMQDEAYALKASRDDRQAAQIEQVIDNQHTLLFNQFRGNANLLPSEIVEQLRTLPNYQLWDNDDWKKLEEDLTASYERKTNAQELIEKGRLGDTNEAWLKQYPSYFDDDDQFQEDLKTYRSDSSRRDKINAGGRLNSKIDAARDEQNKARRSDKFIKNKATRFVEDFIAAGNPDDPRYDKSIVSGALLGQGDDIYDVVRRLSRSVDDELYNKLITEVGYLIKDNPAAKMRPAVLEAFKTLYISTPGQAATNLRQADLDVQTKAARKRIDAKKADVEKQTGEKISDDEAVILVQEDLASMLAADAEKISLNIQAVRGRVRPRGRYDELPEATRGMDPVTGREFIEGVGDIASAALRSFPGGLPARGQ